MPLKVRFSSAIISKLVLAKVGNPSRDEPLQTSKEVFSVTEDDQIPLTTLFLRPFKNLQPMRFHHHSSLSQHEVNNCAKAVFDAPSKLLPVGIEIAQRLYAKSTHPNIKSGDLCIALVDEIEVEGEIVNGICILKSESMVPFISITAGDGGDLELQTVQGINPEKIDKGCLILNLWGEKGYYVQTFDRAGAESRFWVKEFLGVQPIPDSAYLTNTYANMVTDFIEKQAPLDAPPEENFSAAREALAFFDDREHFDLQEFEEKVLKTPEAITQFAEHRTRLEEEQGVPLETAFEISQKDIRKVQKKLSAIMKLDTGVEIHVKGGPETEPESMLERGFDEEKGMSYIKVFYNEMHTTV